MAKILLIEDEESLRTLYSRILASRNYIVETAENGQEALMKLNEFRPDLIVLDIVMPGYNGMEFLKILKNNEELKVVPVLMLSAVSEITKIRECLDMGAVGYITKESAVDEIVQKLNLVLDSFRFN
ncbi:MAG: response regulator [Deltaproteobacteria bacterium]